MLKASLGKIAEMSGGRLLRPEDASLEIAGISTDTRTIKDKNFYIPLKGENFDGNKFIQDAIDKGACGTFWEEDLGEPSGDFPVILVEDSTQAMFQLANSYRNSIEHLIVIGLTGSNGKTTTKDISYALLSQKYKVEKTPENQNNEIGMSKTLLNLKEDTEICILEMGADNFGDLSLLTKIAQPDYALLLNVGDSHLEQLGTKENIARAKLEILEGLREGGFFLYNGDDVIIKRILKEFKLPESSFTFGTNEDSDFVLDSIKFDETGHTFSLNERIYTVPILGYHQIYNGACGIILAKWLDLTYPEIAKGLLSISITGMRNELTHLKDFSILDDSYKSNPQSLNSFLQTAYSLDQYPCKIAIIGDMLELGKSAIEIHENIGESIDLEKLDYLITYGDLAFYIYEQAKNHFPENRVFHFSDKASLLGKVKELIIPNSLVLLKASRSLALETIVEQLKDYKLS